MTVATVTTLSIPSPNTLGVTPAAQEWTVTLAQLEAMGLGTFQFQEASQGGWVFVGQMHTSQPGRHQRIATAPAATRGDAIQLALAEAQRWAAGAR